MTTGNTPQHALMASDEKAALDRLKAELGMPPAGEMVQVFERGMLGMYGEQWRGWSISHTGIRMEPMRDPPWPWYSHSGAGEVFLQVWQTALYPPDGDAYVARRWHPERGTSTALYGLECIAKMSEAEAALKGARLLEMLNLYDTRGRRSGTGTWRNAEDCRRSILRAMRALLATDDPPTQENVAAWLNTNLRHRNHGDGFTDRTVRAWLTTYTLDWGTLRREAESNR